MVTFYADPAGFVRVEVRKGKKATLLGTFGLSGNNGVPFVPGAKVEVEEARLDEVAKTLALYGDPPYVYRQSPHPLLPDPAVAGAEPDAAPDEQAGVDRPPDETALSAGDENPTRRR